MNFEMNNLFWVNKPNNFIIKDKRVEIITDPNTDFWQRTYYGFRNDNAHALLTSTEQSSFSFSVRTDFSSKKRFDQCGVIVYQNSDNWFKASIEFENEAYQRLGSVVTNHGYSDWATVDIDSKIKTMHYRLSRRQSDYCIEYSQDGADYRQMRIFHLFEGSGQINFGLYACSPLDSSFSAVFTEMDITECKWSEHI